MWFLFNTEYIIMKKLFFATAMLALMTVEAVAQNSKGWNDLGDGNVRIVELSSSDVNLRQAASANSARLVKTCNEEGPCHFEWVTGALKPLNSWGIGQEPVRAEVLTAIETVKGDDGENWLHCWYSTDILEFVKWDVYVKEKYTKPATLKPLDKNGKLSTGSDERNYFDDIVLKQNGEYKSVTIAVQWNDMDQEGNLFLGGYLNGMLVMVYELPYSNGKSNSNMNNPLWIENGMLWFDKRLRCNDCYLSGTFDLHKLCANQQYLSLLIKMCSKPEYEKPRIYCAVEGKDKWFVF